MMDDDNEALVGLKSKVRDAWLLLLRLPDHDARFRRGLRNGWPFTIVCDAKESYGYNPVRLSASPREITEMENVMGWMSWLLLVDGKVAVQRILAWSTGVPWREIAASERCSRRTVQYRMNRSFAAIMARFCGHVVKVAMPPPEERLRRRKILAFTTPRGRLEAGPLPDAGKVFIGSEGFRFHGNPYRPALRIRVENLP